MHEIHACENYANNAQIKTFNLRQRFRRQREDLILMLKMKVHFPRVTHEIQDDSDDYSHANV